GACDAVFASHVLEHLTREDLETALKETLRIMRPGAVFRLIVPDLKVLAEEYLKRLKRGDPEASSTFMRDGYFGVESRPKGLLRRLESMLGNSAHLWMWDEVSMTEALVRAGFRDVRPVRFGDADIPAFAAVEAQDRFTDAVALEARK
ncbi:MAG TPA: methyltransferase domain-containing protein, partial [Caulobacteraceae bacterium]